MEDLQDDLPDVQEDTKRYWHGRHREDDYGDHRKVTGLKSFRVSEKVERTLYDIIRGVAGTTKDIAEKEIDKMSNEEFCTAKATPTFKKQFRLKVKHQRDEEPKHKEVLFSPVQLAVVFKSKLVLPIIYKKMKENIDFFKMAINATAINQEHLDVDDDDDVDSDDDEVYQPTLLHLAIKYNEEALRFMLNIGKEYGLTNEIFKLEDSRKVNLLHYAAMQPTTKCLDFFLSDDADFGEESMWTRTARRLLYNSRNRDIESPLHTVRSQEMLDYLLKSKRNDSCRQEISDMLYSRDKLGYNILRTYVHRAKLDLAKRFLDHHVTGIETDSTALCLDMSPMIGEACKIVHGACKVHGEQTDKCWRDTDEIGVISELIPITPLKRELIRHPVINTFVTIKYNSYWILIGLLLLLRFLVCQSLTRIALMVHDAKDTSTLNELKPMNSASFWMEYAFTMCAAILLAVSGTVNVVKNRGSMQGMSFWFQAFGAVVYLYVAVHLVLLAFVETGTCGDLDPWLTDISGLLVLACWGGFTSALRFIMIGRLYNLGLYIRVIKEVIFKVVIFLALYFTTLMGFTLAFSIMIEGDKFNLGPQNLYQIPKTMAMLVGEIDYGDNFADRSTIVSFLFLVFTILVPIIINNLLIGFTVSDVDYLLKSVNMVATEFKLRNIRVLDDTFMMRLLDFLARRIMKQSSKVSYKENSLEVALKSDISMNNVLSSEGMTTVFEVNRKEGNRVVGEAWGFMGVASYVNVSVGQEARRAINNFSVKKGNKEEDNND